MKLNTGFGQELCSTKAGFLKEWFWHPGSEGNKPSFHGTNNKLFQVALPWQGSEQPSSEPPPELLACLGLAAFGPSLDLSFVMGCSDSQTRYHL